MEQKPLRASGKKRADVSTVQLVSTTINSTWACFAIEVSAALFLVR
jgi:hypothetical protein